MTPRTNVIALLRLHGFRCDVVASSVDEILILVEPAGHVVGEGQRLKMLLEKNGVKVGKAGNEDGHAFILGTYDPADHEAFLSLWGVEDKDLGPN